MVTLSGYSLIVIVSFCFGLVVSFQLAHIQYVRYLIGLAKRSIMSGTLAPVFSELELRGGEI